MMTIQNREKFLDHLVGQLGRERITEGVKRPEWTVQPQHRVLKDASKADLVSVLEEQCKEIHADFVKTDLVDLGVVLGEILKKYDAKSLISASGERLKKFGLSKIYQEFSGDGIEIHLWDSATGEENLQFAERADVGITFSDLTLAESGTVTLLNDK